MVVTLALRPKVNRVASPAENRVCNPLTAQPSTIYRITQLVQSYWLPLNPMAAIAQRDHSRSVTKGQSRSVTIRVAWPFGQGQSHCINASIDTPATMLKVEERASFETGLLTVAIA
ncbi:MAG: hypothetical protein F6J90_37130 [Moorea sp. SIOASIH]|uniref:hypothetical protein n=1 Tax=Moorena sp. SIOASIH TaxID=2607817 RepID=UPI0013B8F38B|nr:hypothetical protein [Moorena sp. SIOASIH]NEO41653.1 hypothetical protein [Moorena sp. SIOASIH]